MASSEPLATNHDPPAWNCPNFFFNPRAKRSMSITWRSWTLADKAFYGHRSAFAAEEPFAFLARPGNSSLGGWRAFRG